MCWYLYCFKQNLTQTVLLFVVVTREVFICKVKQVKDFLQLFRYLFTLRTNFHRTS